VDSFTEVYDETLGKKTEFGAFLLQKHFLSLTVSLNVITVWHDNRLMLNMKSPLVKMWGKNSRLCTSDYAAILIGRIKGFARPSSVCPTLVQRLHNSNTKGRKNQGTRKLCVNFQLRRSEIGVKVRVSVPQL